MWDFRNEIRRIFDMGKNGKDYRFRICLKTFDGVHRKDDSDPNPSCDIIKMEDDLDIERPLFDTVLGSSDPDHFKNKPSKEISFDNLPAKHQKELKTILTSQHNHDVATGRIQENKKESNTMKINKKEIMESIQKMVIKPLLKEETGSLLKPVEIKIPFVIKDDIKQIVDELAINGFSEGTHYTLDYNPGESSVCINVSESLQAAILCVINKVEAGENIQKSKPLAASIESPLAEPIETLEPIQTSSYVEMPVSNMSAIAVIDEPSELDNPLASLIDTEEVPQPEEVAAMELPTMEEPEHMEEDMLIDPKTKNEVPEDDYSVTIGESKMTLSALKKIVALTEAKKQKEPKKSF